jgi:hypothetical protein
MAKILKLKGLIHERGFSAKRKGFGIMELA